MSSKEKKEKQANQIKAMSNIEKQINVKERREITAKQAIINADKILGASVSEVDNDGSIVGEDKQEATASIRTETKTFLESIWGVAKRTGATNIVEFKL